MSDPILLGINLLMLIANAYMVRILHKQSSINLELTQMLFKAMKETK